MNLREVACPEYMRGCEPPKPWPLVVLVLTDAPGPREEGWLDQRRGRWLDAGESCQVAGHSLSATGPNAFQRISVRSIACTEAELEEEFAEDLPAEKSSIYAQVQSPLRRAVRGLPTGLILVDVTIRPERLEALAEIARWAGAPIVHRGAARPPWVFTSLHWVPGMLDLWSITGWVGDSGLHREPGLAMLAARITGWLNYGSEAKSRAKDLDSVFSECLPEERFVWMDDRGEVLSPAIERAQLHQNIGSPGRVPCELELAVAAPGASVAGRFPFIVDNT